MNRIFITSADIAQLEGISLGYARKVMRDIKKALDKDYKKKLTFAKYAAYYKIEINEIERALKQSEKRQNP
ncbi:MAG TPA: hypothetical protein ENK64_01660 [Flavobacteriales bacterium]|nr:hypothetical protein [Flavobacteriales bacterium]